ncbi:hypothetical protein GW17_00027103, partial [Ensete ventricosum]
KIRRRLVFLHCNEAAPRSPTGRRGNRLIFLHCNEAAPRSPTGRRGVASSSFARTRRYLILLLEGEAGTKRRLVFLRWDEAGTRRRLVFLRWDKVLPRSSAGKRGGLVFQR